MSDRDFILKTLLGFFLGIIFGSILYITMTAISNSKEVGYEMPPEKYWNLPITIPVYELSCKEYTTFIGVYVGGGGETFEKENADCHLSGMYIPKFDPKKKPFVNLAIYGKLGTERRGNLIVIVKGMSQVLKEMVLVHENAHAHGWKHGSAGSRIMSTTEWKKRTR